MKVILINSLISVTLFNFIMVDDVIFCVPVFGDDFDIWGDGNNTEQPGFDRQFSDTNGIRSGDRLPRVLNFFPVPVEEECNATDGRRKGICMNTYECKIEGGKSHGFCALGFGVCCVFTSTCNGVIKNNLTYFVNPDFPDLTTGMTSCDANIKKMNPEIAQIKLEFIHFNLGQPNRATGECEDDVFILYPESTSRQLKICGLNSGQHVYFDLDPATENVKIHMNLSRKAVTRLWEVRITQIPFTQRAPSGCLQYHTGVTGTIQTMNFADNGRHLANQDYSVCVRQEAAMCSIAYEPCHENAFRIDPNNNHLPEESSDVEEGSGNDSDYSENDMSSRNRAMEEICNDKIVMPCDSEELIMPEIGGSIPSGFCTLIHCGSALCPSGNKDCRIESSVTPFTIGIHFGSTTRDVSPDENLGMCLVYEQQPCND